MASEKPTRRKPAISCERDPRTYVASGFVTYVEQFVAGSWREVLAVTGWRPSRAVVVHRSQLDAEALRWLAEFNRMNNGHSGELK
jgi:hypothetical protein